MKFVLMNAAGTVKTPAALQKVLRCESNAETTIGSYTLPQRNGNPGNRLFNYEKRVGISHNSLGLPNGGLAYLQNHLPTMYAAAKAAGKRLRVSVSGTPDEIAEMISYIMRVAPDAIIEINGSCPNVWSEAGKQKSMAGYIPRQVQMLIAAAHTAGSRHTAFKMPLILDPAQLHDMVDVMLEMHRIGTLHEIVYANASPNSFLWKIWRDHEQVLRTEPAIDFGTGLAGGAGPANIGAVAGGVIQIKEQTRNTDLLLTAVGGVHDGWSLAQYLLCGADKVQINTAYYEHEDPTIFSAILTDFANQYPELAERFI